MQAGGLRLAVPGRAGAAAVLPPLARAAVSATDSRIPWAQSQWLVRAEIHPRQAGPPGW